MLLCTHCDATTGHGRLEVGMLLHNAFALLKLALINSRLGVSDHNHVEAK